MQSNYYTHIKSLGDIQLSGNTVTIDGGTGNVNISGSLNVVSGSLIMNGPTGSATSIQFPFNYNGADLGSGQIYQNSNGDLVISPGASTAISSTNGNGSINLPGSQAYINFGFDNVSGNTEMIYGGISYNASGSLMQAGGGFVQDLISDTDSGQVFGFALSTYNTNDNSLSANFYGPGTGNNVVYGSNDNVVFQIPMTGSTLGIYRDTVITGTLATTAGFTQQRLTTDQELTTGSDTVVTFNYSDFDPSGWYNSEFFYFQPTVAGVYEVNYSITWVAGISGTGQVNVQVHKNGDQIAINQQQLNLIDNMTQTGTVFVQMNGTTDQLNLTAYTSCSAGQTIAGGNGTYINFKLV